MFSSGLRPLNDGTTYWFRVRSCASLTSCRSASNERFITVRDSAPNFGSGTIADQLLIRNQNVSAADAIQFPAATGGNAPLNYTFTPNPPAGLTFDATDRKIPGSPNTNQTATPYTYTVTDSDAAEPDSRSLEFDITVEDESLPVIPDIANQVYFQGQSLGPNGVTLPAADGGNGTVTYTLSPALSNGLSFNAATRTITGTPSSVQTATTYTLTATDSDTYGPDSDTATFTIETLAQAQDLAPSFGAATIAPQILIQNQLVRARETVELPEATGGNGTLSYSISPDLPDGMSMNRDRQIVGTPTTVQPATTYTWRATDSDTVNPESATLTFTIEVATDQTPNFNDATILNQLYIQNVTNVNLTLPAATGGNGALTYSLVGNLPTGLTFNANTRTITGTPTATWRNSQYTYTATDSDLAGPDSVDLTFTIQVDASDTGPRFGSQTIDNKIYIANVDYVLLTLPAATGGNAPLTYTLSPALPAGLFFDPSSRDISGRPTAATQGAATYTYTVTDADTPGAESDSLTFTIEVAEDLIPNFNGATIPNQLYIQNVNNVNLALPAATGGNGALTYSLVGNLPSGLSFDAANRTITGTPDVAYGGSAYAYRATDSDTLGPDSASLIFSIQVDASDETPTFASRAVDNQVYIQNVTNANLTLPRAAGGNGDLTYTLSPVLPSGLTFDTETETPKIEGTPTTVQGATTYTYTVTDSDTPGPETDTLTFTIQVDASDLEPNFDGASIADQLYIQDQAVSENAAVTLPAATGGNQPLTYSISPALPGGLSFDADSRKITGTPTSTYRRTSFTYTATDSDTPDPEMASLSFRITVDASDSTPSFGNETIDDQVYFQGVEVTSSAAVELPAATGGNEPLSYTITPGLPVGLTFNAGVRKITGTPTVAQGAVTYTYTVTDADTYNAEPASLTFTIRVDSTDTSPNFGSAVIYDHVYIQNDEVTANEASQLPAATGGNGTLTYSITPNLPPGLSFDAGARKITGTPTSVFPNAGFTYTVTDSDAVDPDSVSLTFNIAVHSINLEPSFGAQSVTDQVYIVNDTVVDVALPEATGGNRPLILRLTPALPQGLTFNVDNNRKIKGTPTVAQGNTPYTYTVTDSDAVNPDSATLTFHIRVDAQDLEPTFGSKTIDTQRFTKDEAIDAVQLPTATGGNGKLNYTITPSMPSGLTFNADASPSPTITGTPDRDLLSGREFTYKVTDSDANNPESATLTFTIYVIPERLALDPLDPAAFVYVNGANVTSQLPVSTGGVGRARVYTIIGDLPAGLSFNADQSVRTISGKPTAATPPATYTYVVEDESGDTVSIRFTITVTTTTIAGTIRTQIFPPNQAITPVQLPAATGGTAPYAYTVSPALPDGLSFDADANSRAISGTPTEAFGTLTFTYTATDANGVSGSLDFMIRDRLPVLIRPTVDLDTSFGNQMVANQTYTQNVRIPTLQLPEATDGNEPLTYSLSPALPDGLSFDAATRQLTGTPTSTQAAATYTYRATDADGDQASRRFTITIKAALDSAPSFGSEAVPNQTYTQNVAIQTLQLPAATGGVGALTYSLSPAPPSGLTFDAATRQLTGTPTAAQKATAFIYTATDADGDEVSATFTITVEAANLTPSFGVASVPNQTYTQNVAISTLQLPAATGGDGAITYGLSPAPPAGLSFDAATRQITGTPTAAQGAATYTYTATDADGDRASRSFTIAVAPLGDGVAPTAPTLTASAGDGQARLSWSGGGDHKTGWQYAQSTESNDMGTWTNVPGSDGDTTSYTVTGLTNGVTYHFQVRGHQRRRARSGLQPGVSQAAGR